MESPRYYLVAVSVLALAGASPALTQSANPPVPADCDLLISQTDAPETPEYLKRLLDCGLQLNTDNEYRRSQPTLERAIEVAERLSDRKTLSAALAAHGVASLALGQGDRAEQLLQRSRTVADEIQDTDGVAYAYSQLGRVRTTRARYAEARDFHMRSFELWNEVGNRRGVAIALNNVGASNKSLGDYVTALNYFQRSLDELERIGDQRRSTTVLDNMGTIAQFLGDYPRARELTSKALELRKAFKDREGTAKSLDSLSWIYQAEGNYAKALDLLQQSLELRQALGVAHGTAETLNNIAVVYKAQGNYTQATAYLRRSLEINEKVENQSLLAEIHTHLGTLSLLQGEPARAIESLQRGLAISRAQGYRTQAADGLYALARVYAEQGQLTAAGQSLKECLELREASGEQRGRAEALVEMANVERRRGRHVRGMELASEAQRLAGAMELPEVQWRAWTVIGRLHAATGRRREARDSFESAIGIVEGLRFQLAGGDETRSSFFAERLAPYQERIALALAESQPADAFYFAERSKARALLDVIRADRMPITTAMSVEERRREIELRTSLSGLNSQVLLISQAASRDEVRLGDVKRKRDAARLAYEDFQARLYASHPELRVGRADVPVARAPEALGLLAGPAAAIVEFVVGPQKTWAFALVGSRVEVFEVRVTAAELERQVTRFRDQLANRDLRASDTARQLHQLVLGPMYAALAGKTELIIVPDGVLWDLPFQALRSGAGRYLIEDAAVSYAPSVTVLRETMRLRGRSTNPTLLAFGNPTFGPEAVQRRKTVLMDDRLEPLPEAEAQVNRLAQLYGASSRVYVGREAREDRFRSEAGQYGILHLATHGVADNRSPLYSYVVLAKPDAGGGDDGLVEAWEIMSLQLKADLVVLSACETARGRISAGEGVIGLMWAFFVAGAPATLVSQWKVESASSTALMVAFHEEWNAGRKEVSKARALQSASLRLLQTSEYSHPFYWAGYILAGDRR